MATLNIDENKCDLCGICQTSCPFGAIDIVHDKIEMNSACKMCKICIKNCPCNAITFANEQTAAINKDEWKGIMVFIDHLEGEIHPVSFELIGKATQLAKKISQPVYCVFIGSDIFRKAKDLLCYGVDKVFVYDYEQLRHYRVDIYANAFGNCIRKVKPSIVLVGATSVGRSLAPRLSTRFRTGLTADCTVLDVRENSDLVQIRPAFGGNIMAQIITPNSRPQFATVRYKVMDQAKRVDIYSGKIEICTLRNTELNSRIKVLNIIRKEKQVSISDSEVLVVAGRGLKAQKDLAMIEKLANLLGGQIAVTRPLVEAGWASYTQQIGLSGRTVKPKLIITCGVSGAIQFTACMNTAEYIFAINNDRNAQMLKIAHYGIVGDLYEIIPALIDRIKQEGNLYAV